MPFDLVSGLRLYYERHGERGEPLVFVHGYTGDTTDWRCQVPAFSRDFQVLLLDNRGHGRSEVIALRSPERLLSLTLHDTAGWGQGEGPGPSLPYTPPELALEAQARTKRMSPDVLVGALNGLKAWLGTMDRAHAIATPTLVICGDRDMPRIVDGSRALAELIPNAELVIIEGAGHSPQRERPGQYNAALRRFLERVRASYRRRLD